MQEIDDKLIVALDVDTLNKAEYFINRLYPKIKIFKVGIQLFTGCGPRIIRFINKKGAEVFLDLKFFDIPNAVANAVRQVVPLRVKMLTLHIAGDKDMLKSAVKAARKESRRLNLKRPLLLGVTVLTSQKAEPEEVLKLARIGLKCGLDGIVCSAKETSFLRKQIKKKFVIVTPGIRPKGAQAADQRRVATVREAIQAGSDFLVVGRPVLEAKDPLKIVEEIALAVGAVPVETKPKRNQGDCPYQAR